MELMNEDEQCIFDERAAICEYDGGLTRDEAETIAYLEILDRRNKNDK